jgi:prevent-host-death family protein
MPTISVAEAKSHLSELLAKCAYKNEKLIITKRNKPIAALVSMDDLRKIEQYDERKGLAGLTGKWSGFEEIAASIDDLESLRKSGGAGRDVSF